VLKLLVAGDIFFIGCRLLAFSYYLSVQKLAHCPNESSYNVFNSHNIPVKAGIVTEEQLRARGIVVCLCRKNKRQKIWVGNRN